jgi:isoleucyl-tRNA synthetase
MRKIRNSARFILGNIGTVAQRKYFVPAQRNELGLVSPVSLSDIYKPDRCDRRSAS